MGLKIRFDRQARDDLVEIRRFLVQHAGGRSADRVRQHLRERIELLSERPLLGVRTVLPDVRVLFPTRYPYRIYYTVAADMLIILHIRHTSRAEPEATELGN